MVYDLPSDEPASDVGDAIRVLASRSSRWMSNLAAAALLGGIILVLAVEFGIRSDLPHLKWYAFLSQGIQLLVPFLILSAVLQIGSWVVILLADSPDTQ